MSKHQEKGSTEFQLGEMYKSTTYLTSLAKQMTIAATLLRVPSATHQNKDI